MYRLPGYKNDLFESPADPVKLKKDLDAITKMPYSAGSKSWLDFLEKLWDDGNLTEDILTKFSPFFNGKDWDNIMCYFSLSDDFLRSHRFEMDMHSICRMQAANISESFIELHSREFGRKDWYYISSRAPVSEKFIENHFIDYPWDWEGLSARVPCLAEWFLNKYELLFDWSVLSDCFGGGFSMDFMIKHCNRFDWETIVYKRWNALTPELVIEFLYKINKTTLLSRKDLLIKYRGFDEEFFDKYGI